MFRDNKLNQVRYKFFNSILKYLDSWKVLYITSRFVSRAEPLLTQYSKDTLLIKKLYYIHDEVNKKIDVIRLRMLYSEEDINELESFSEVDSYAARLFSAAFDEDLPKELFDLYLEIAKFKEKNITYPCDSVIKAIENLLYSAFTYTYYSGEDDEDVDDISSDNELAYDCALESIVYICDSFDFLGKYGWNHLIENFICDMEYVNMLKVFEVAVYPNRNIWINGEPLGWMNHKMGEVKRIPINRVFISYAWIESDQAYNDWIEKFIIELEASGLKIIFDKWNLELGSPLAHFIESSIDDSEKVIMLLTPEYANRSNNNIGGVGKEWSIIKADLNKNPMTKKYIGVLKKGSWEFSVPAGFEGYLSIDFMNEEKYDKNLTDLVCALLNIPNRGNVI